MARAVVLRTFSLSTLYLEMSKPTADSDNSLRGIPKAVLVCPSVWKPAIKESREARLDLALVLMPLEEVAEFFRMSACFLARLFLVTKFFGRVTFFGDFTIFIFFLARPFFFSASCRLLGEGLLEFSIFLQRAVDLTSVFVEGQRWNGVKCTILLAL